MKPKSILAVVLAIAALVAKLIWGGSDAPNDSANGPSGAQASVESTATLERDAPRSTQGAPKSAQSSPEKLGRSSKELYAAIRERRSNQWCDGSAIVVKLLPDDDDGARHQKFLAELDDGSTLLFAHNIDLAPRASVDTGDILTFRGRYEWNEKGGVVHWTHHDPDDPTRGGWLKVDGDVFQ